MNYIPQIYKALVPIVVGLALTALSYVGIADKMTVEEALTTLATSCLIWLVPNKKQ